MDCTIHISLCRSNLCQPPDRAFHACGEADTRKLSVMGTSRRATSAEHAPVALSATDNFCLHAPGSTRLGTVRLAAQREKRSGSAYRTRRVSTPTHGACATGALLTASEYRAPPWASRSASTLLPRRPRRRVANRSEAVLGPLGCLPHDMLGAMTRLKYSYGCNTMSQWVIAFPHSPGLAAVVVHCIHHGTGTGPRTDSLVWCEKCDRTQFF